MLFILYRFNMFCFALFIHLAERIEFVKERLDLLLCQDLPCFLGLLFNLSF